MPLRSGDYVGPYRIMAQVGQGGMATVYRAHHEQLDRMVAIKVMHQSMLEDASFHARFKREAQIVAMLEHPNIVPVYDYSEHEGQPYLVMKFIEGRSLKQELSTALPSLERIVYILSAVADALTYAHNRGVLHRDVKPSNIVLEGDQHPYLTDFGLARIAHTGESSMSRDTLIGTPNYISPEQAKGTRELDARTDIYSLGVVLYELMVGRVPFIADTPYAVIHDHIYAPLPMPAVVNPDIPPEVELVLVKALAKRPADRYSSAVEMLNDFKQALTDSGLAGLSPNRIEIATESIARIRAEQELAINADDYRSPAIPNPVYLSATGSTRAQRYFPHARRWMIGGIIAFLLLCAGSSFVTLSALGGMRQINDTTIEFLLDSGTTDDNSIVDAQIGVLYLLDLSVENAEEMLANSPEDPLLYLALARAHYVVAEQDAANQAVQNGVIYTDDPVSYYMTAARVADDYGYRESAVVYYALALGATAVDSERFPLVREETGSYLYQFALDVQTGDDIFEFIRDRSGVDLEAPGLRSSLPLLQVTRARALLTNGNIRLANSAINLVLTGMPDLPEARLVQGEILAAQDDTTGALEAWRFVLQNPETPPWVQQRATALIANTSQE